MCDSATFDSGVTADEIRGPSEPEVSPEGEPTSAPKIAGLPGVSKDGVPAQITVLPEDELDPQDADLLQIPVHEDHKAYVLAGAKSLLATQELGDDKATAIQLAQGLLHDIARADLVVMAETVEVSEIKGNPGQKRFTFVTKELVKGESPETWSLDFQTEPGSCGLRPPQINDAAIFFLRLTEDGPSLVDRGAIGKIKDGKLVGFPGLAPETANLITAHVAGLKEMQP